MLFEAFLPYYSFSQTSFDVSGIWTSNDYRCYEISDANVWNFFSLKPEVFMVNQQPDGFVSATKCIGDKCVPAGYVSWQGTIIDSTIYATFTTGSIGCPGCGAVPVKLLVMSDTAMNSDFNTSFRKISCAKYRQIVMPAYGTYYDCQICNDYFEIPNVFTPNGDGVNDEWTFFLPQDLALLNFDIYDRWGILVKTVTKQKAKKDGTHISKEKWNGNSINGVPCSSGVYFYTIKYQDSDKKIQTKSGYIQLLRE